MAIDKINSGPIRILKAILWTRFIFGFFHQDLIKSNRARYLAKTYCVLVTAVFFVARLHNVEGSLLAQIAVIASAIDYLFPSVLSLCFRTYCSMDYLNEVLSRCEVRHTKTMSRLLVTIYILSSYNSIGNVLLNIPMYFLSIGEFPIDLFRYLVFSPCLRTGLEFGIIIMWISLILMYCDMKALFDAVERVNFQRREIVFDFIVKYEKICNGFDKVMPAVKITLFYRLISMWPQIMLFLYTFVIESPNSPAVEQGIPPRQILAQTVFSFLRMLPLVLLDRLADLEDKIVVCILDKKIICSDSATRAEMDCFVSYVRERPPRFSLWRAVPLEGRLALGIGSLAISYIIAGLQLSRITK